MKKLSLLLVVLLAAGSAGLYGQMAIGTNFSISGSATATAGYDIDDEQFGFKNESSANIKIEFVAKQSANNHEKVDMSGGWYGSIELKDFQIVINSDEEDSAPYVKAYKAPANGNCADVATTSYKKDDFISLECAGIKDTRAHERSKLVVIEPAITATLKNGPLFLQIFDEPASKADLIPHIENDPIKTDDNAAESDDENQDVGADLAGPGITVGYKTSDLTFKVGLASDVPYDKNDDLSTPAKDESAGSFTVSADLKVNVGPATVDLAFVQGLKNEDDADANADDTGVGVLLTTVFGEVSLSAGADVHMTGEDDLEDTNENEAMKFDIGGNAAVTLTELTSLKSTFLHSTNAAAATDVEVVLSDKSGLVQDLSMDLTWGLFDITGGEATDATTGLANPADANDKSDLFVQADLSYAIAVGDDMDDMGDDEMMMKGPTFTPGAKVTVNQLDGGDAAVGLELRAILEHAIPATTFGLKWATGQLVDSGAMKAKQGIITLWTKIVY